MGHASHFKMEWGMQRFFKYLFSPYTIKNLLGTERVLQGNTSHGAMLLEPGVVKHAGTGYITISSPSQVSLNS